MTQEDLHQKLEQNKIPPSWYSLNEGLKIDAFNIAEVDGAWECFYYSETGEKNNSIIVDDAEKAYHWLWQKVKYQKKTSSRFS
jgi:hypothetical protein